MKGDPSGFSQGGSVFSISYLFVIADVLCDSFVIKSTVHVYLHPKLPKK